MDYKEKYEKALERAGEVLGCGPFNKGSIEYIFPELKESGDEKIRKALIDFFNKGAENGEQTNGIYDKDILTWLKTR